MIPSFFVVPTTTTSTTVRTSWNVESRPVFHVESACQLHLAIAPLVVPLQAKSAPILMIPSFFVVPPSPVSTTVRTSWRMESRPVLRAESTCHLCLSIAPLVLPLLPESVPILADPDFFYPPPQPLSTTVRTSWNTESTPVLHSEFACQLRF